MLPRALAIERGTPEVIVFLVVDEDADLAPDKQVFALFAKTRFIQRPPLLEGIVCLHDL